MIYATYHITLATGTTIDVIATSIDAAKADIAAAYENAEILTYSMTE